MMEEFPLFPTDKAASYRICVTGVLESDWVERVWGLTSVVIEGGDEPQQTLLSGEIIDQSKLVGIINALYNAGYTVLSVERLLSGGSAVDS